jgi:hypothetical protein
MKVFVLVADARGTVNREISVDADVREGGCLRCG